MDLWEMTGLSPRQGLFLAAAGLVLAAAMALRAFVGRTAGEAERGLRLNDRQ